MPVLHIHCEGEGCWPDLEGQPNLINLMGPDAPAIGLALLPEGTASGRPSVCLRIELPDGRVVLTETTLALFDQAHAIFHAYLAGKAERGQATPAAPAPTPSPAAGGTDGGPGGCRTPP